MKIFTENILTSLGSFAFQGLVKCGIQGLETFIPERTKNFPNVWMSTTVSDLQQLQHKQTSMSTTLIIPTPNITKNFFSTINEHCNLTNVISKMGEFSRFVNENRSSIVTAHLGYAVLFLGFTRMNTLSTVVLTPLCALWTVYQLGPYIPFLTAALTAALVARGWFAFTSAAPTTTPTTFGGLVQEQAQKTTVGAITGGLTILGRKIKGAAQSLNPFSTQVAPSPSKELTLATLSPKGDNMAATIISSSTAVALPVASGIGKGLLCRALNSSIYGPLEMIWGSGAARQLMPKISHLPPPPTPWAAWMAEQVAQRALASGGAAPQGGFSWGLWGGGALATGLFAYGAWKWCNRPRQEPS